MDLSYHMTDPWGYRLLYIINSYAYFSSLYDMWFNSLCIKKCIIRNELSGSLLLLLSFLLNNILFQGNTNLYSGLWYDIKSSTSRLVRPFGYKQVTVERHSNFHLSTARSIFDQFQKSKHLYILYIYSLGFLLSFPLFLSLNQTMLRL